MKDSDDNLAKVEAAMAALKLAMTGAKERFSEGLQLTRTQLEILMMLSAEPLTTGQLAKRLYLTQSAVTQTVDTLVRRDLIQRRTDPHDRRITRLSLSPPGQDITRHILTMRRDFWRSTEKCPPNVLA